MAEVHWIDHNREARRLGRMLAMDYGWEMVEQPAWPYDFNDPGAYAIGGFPDDVAPDDPTFFHPIHL